MKTIVKATFVAALFAGGATAALAQDHDRGQAHDQGGGRPYSGGPRAGGAAPAAPAAAAAPRAAPAGPAQSPQGGHARFGAPPSAPGAPAPQADRGQRFNGPGAGPGGGERHGDRGPGGSGGSRTFDHSRGPTEVIPPAGAADRGRDGRRDGHDGRWDGRDGRDGRDSHDARGGRDGRDGRDGHWADGRGPGRGPDNHDGRVEGRFGGRGEHWQAGRYPSVFWSHDRYRLGAYRAPYGFYARSWAFGDILPRAWFGRDYYLDDFLDFGLPYPPPGYEWVRVGGDAIMVEMYSGRVAQVVRGIFY